MSQTITISDVTLIGDVEIDKSDVLAEFETDELLKEVRAWWTDWEILEELDRDKVEAWVDDMNEPVWASNSTYSTYTDEDKRQFGIPRRLKF